MKHFLVLFVALLAALTPAASGQSFDSTANTVVVGSVAITEVDPNTILVTAGEAIVEVLLREPDPNLLIQGDGHVAITRDGIEVQVECSVFRFGFDEPEEDGGGLGNLTGTRNEPKFVRVNGFVFYDQVAQARKTETIGLERSVFFPNGKACEDKACLGSPAQSCAILSECTARCADGFTACCGPQGCACVAD